jgi:hypothetical protein
LSVERQTAKYSQGNLTSKMTSRAAQGGLIRFTDGAAADSKIRAQDRVQRRRAATEEQLTLEDHYRRRG